MHNNAIVPRASKLSLDLRFGATRLLYGRTLQALELNRECPMNRESWFKTKWLYLQRFAILGVVGLLSIVLFTTTKNDIFIAGILLISPLLLLLIVMPILHWKDRYIGVKSTLWGTLLLIETSGWFKIIYWFRHILPDWKKSGRYSNSE